MAKVAVCRAPVVLRTTNILAHGNRVVSVVGPCMARSEINLIDMNLCITYLADTVNKLETW
jgi:hypothetical protein